MLVIGIEQTVESDAKKCPKHRNVSAVDTQWIIFLSNPAEIPWLWPCNTNRTNMDLF
jgi:hypothetical protein